MDERERRSEIPAPAGGGNPTAGGEESMRLSEIRQEADQFLRAGDEAIRRSLSGDSSAFLSNSRQHGGE
jgi:hypothetical protein